MSNHNLAGGAGVHAVSVPARTMPLASVALLAVALGSGGGAPALAQPAANLDVFRSAPGPEDGFALDRPAVGPHLGLSVRLHLEYANDPLVFEAARGQAQTETTRLVSDQLRVHPSVAFGLFDLLLLYAALPIDLVMAGDALGDLPTATGAGLGDLRLGARAALVRGGAVRLSGQLEATLPTAPSGEQGRPGVAGDAGATLQPKLIGELGSERLAWTLEFGVRLRRDAQFAGVRFKDALVGGTGVAWDVVPSTWRLLIEALAETPLSDLGDRGGSRLDGLLGGQLRLDGHWTLGAAGGVGLARGYGEPDARAVVSLGYQASLLTPSAARASEAPPVRAPARRPEAQPIAPPEHTEQVSPEALVVTPAPAAEQDAAPPAPVRAAELVKPAPPPPAAATTAQWIAALAATPNADPDSDHIPNKRDKCPLAPGKKAARGCPRGHRVDLAGGRIELLQPPRFDSGKAELNARLRSFVDEIATTLLANLSMRVVLESHVGSGDAAANLALTQRRAAAVRARLSERGVAAERVQAYGCGESRPVAPNNVPWGRKKNERLELLLLDPTPSSGVHSTQGCLPVD